MRSEIFKNKARVNYFKLLLVLVSSGLLLFAIWISVHEYRLQRPRPIVRFIFPTGFRGFAVLKFDPEAGRSFQMSEDGAVEIIIPESGKLIICKNLKTYLNNWHNRKAEYMDGTSITSDSAEKNEISLRGGTASSDGFFYYLLGTYDEIQKYYADRETWNNFEQ